MFLIGASGHGRVVAEILIGAHPTLRVLDRDPHQIGLTVLDRVVEDEARVLAHLSEPVDFFVAIGASAVRERVIERWLARGHRLATARHPSALVSSTAHLGPGCCFMAGSIVQAGCRLGRGVIINTAATVDHDCRLGDYVHVAPGAHLAGDVTVGDHGWIGIGSVAREGVTIGSGTLVGAGSVIVTDLPEDVVAHGNPCRVARARAEAAVHPV